MNDFTSDEIQSAEKWARKFYAELGTKSPFFRSWFGDWRIHDNKTPVEAIAIPAQVKINKASRKIQNADTRWNIQIGSDVINDSVHYAGKEKPYIERLLSKIDNVLRNAVLLDTAVSTKNSANKKGSTQFMHYMYSLVEYNGNPFLAKITVEEYGTEGKHRAYNVERIKMSTLSRAQYHQMKSAYRGGFASNADAISVADLVELVKQYDKKYTPQSVNPILLDEYGKPKVFYHGTGENFTEFSFEEMSSQEGSFFFAENREDAQAYGKNVMAVYLTGNNLANYDDQPSEFYRLRNKREQVQWLKDRGYDGWYADMDSEGWGEVSVFSQGQIKSATENIGTFNAGKADIQYSFDDDVVELVYSEEDDFSDEGLIRNFDHRDIVAAAVEKHLVKNPLFDNVWVELSRGMGSYETFYITIVFEDDVAERIDRESVQFRFSGHKSRGSLADIYLWNEDYHSIEELLNGIDERIAEMHPSLRQQGEASARFSIEDDVVELDEGYARHMADDDTPEGLAPDDDKISDYHALAKEEKLRRAKNATTNQLKNRIKSSEEAIAAHREAKNALKNHTASSSVKASASSA